MARSCIRVPEDIDTMIVWCALQYAIEGSEVNVVTSCAAYVPLESEHGEYNLCLLSEAGKDLKICRISDLVGQGGPNCNILSSFFAWL